MDQPKSKWLKIDLVPPEPKSKKITLTFDVKSKEGGSSLGSISWWGAWRCYCFFPKNTCLFEKTCLHDIANFLEWANWNHKEAKRIKARIEADKTPSNHPLRAVIQPPTS